MAEPDDVDCNFESEVMSKFDFLILEEELPPEPEEFFDE